MTAPSSFSFQTRLLAALNVRRQESQRVRWLFIHHFCQGFGVALFFTVANALFLAHFPITELPLVFGVAAIAMLLTGRLYAWLEHHIPVEKLMPGVVLTLCGLVGLARLGVDAAGAGAAAFGLVVLHRVIYLLTNLEFWGVSALLLDVRQSKRLFGLISAGDVPAKLLGYLLVAQLGGVIGLPNLLLIAGGGFLASLLVLRKLLAEDGLVIEHDAGHDAHSHHPSGRGHDMATPSAARLTRLFGSPFIAALAGLSFLAVIGFTCVDFAFLEGTQARFGTAAELARFLGLFLGFGKALTIVTKFFFSSRIVERLGVKRALLLPPMLLLVVALGIAVYSSLGAADRTLFSLFGLMLLVAETFRYTLHDPIFLALFQPLSRHLRLHGHTSVKGIVDPIALGATGLLLWGIIRLSHGRIEPTAIMWVLLAVLTAWLLMVLVVSRGYVRVLSTAIRRRFLEGGQVMISDRQALAVLREKLSSPYPEAVIYAVELLSKSDSPALAATLTGLLSHPAEDVRVRVLDKLDEATLRAAQPEVMALTAATATPRVRAAAVAALARLADESAATAVLPFLEEAEPVVRRAAITGLLRAGGLEGVVLAGQQLLQLVGSTVGADRVLASGIIAELGVRTFYKPLVGFLHDTDPAVRRAAVEAAGALANPQLLPALLALLPVRELTDTIGRAIAAYGPAALPLLGQTLTTAPDTAAVVRLLPIVGRIGGTAAEELLTASLLHAPARQVRESALRALRGLDYQAPRGPVQDALLHSLDEYLAQAAWCLRAEEALRTADEPALVPVSVALANESHTARERIFQVLSVLYEPRTVLRVQVGLDNHRRELVASALELLESLLPTRQAVPLGFLLEDVGPAEKLRLLSPHLPAAAQALTPTAVLMQLLTDASAFHRWTVATALAALAEPEPALLHAAASFTSSPVALLRQVALRIQQATVVALPTAAISAESPMSSSHSTATSLLEIEKVVVLKSTSIFAETPEHILVDIAAIVHEERVRAGTVIFEQGDLGDTMYLIYEGEVRIHAGDTTFATLRNRDIFGELALLDPEPRSATATATHESLLLRLNQEDFFELMADRREVAQGILRMLTRRLRAQNKLLAERK